MAPSTESAPVGDNCRDANTLRYPHPRRLLKDLTNPTFEDLFGLALWRVIDIAIPNPADRPPRLFPTAENIRDTFFTMQDWLDFGDMETEYARLSYTLSKYTERGVPARCAYTVAELLAAPGILGRWNAVYPDIRSQATEAMMEALHAMTSGLPTPAEGVREQHYISDLVDYGFSDVHQSIQLQLFHRSSQEIAYMISKGNSSLIQEYVQVHAFVRDPVGGLWGDFSRQVAIFQNLLSGFSSRVANISLESEAWTRVVAQLALESSFLAQPYVPNVSYVHFSSHYQLPYVNVKLDELARAELSVPERVMALILEMLLETLGKSRCLMIPIVVTTVPSLADGNRRLQIIIDGNTRATAVMVLRLLAMSGAERRGAFAYLDTYCQERGLGSKWHQDILRVLRELFKKENTCIQEIRKNHTAVQQFASVNYIPALLVQESVFQTLCLRRGSPEKPRLLQPMHQTLHNDDSSGLALPARSQSHGRPTCYTLLPLK
ncbi:hypothetical protein CNMCM8927_000880 [Aspergillus lentulus]|uniref:Uncharacterized protein n=1 Tax=Aspergillus lentulus TaxID=293939 RepID=A0AAN5YI06_ASPLE|nr:hypothetical protein CNMCM8927_000880 [Aspergillus lentulus]